MVWTKWHGRNGTDNMVATFGIDYNSSKFNTHLVTKSNKLIINTQRKPKGVKMEAGLMSRVFMFAVRGVGFNSHPQQTHQCYKNLLKYHTIQCKSSRNLNPAEILFWRRLLM